MWYIFVSIRVTYFVNALCDGFLFVVWRIVCWLWIIVWRIIVWRIIVCCVTNYCVTGCVSIMNCVTNYCILCDELLCDGLLFIVWRIIVTNYCLLCDELLCDGLLFVVYRIIVWRIVCRLWIIVWRIIDCCVTNYCVTDYCLLCDELLCDNFCGLLSLFHLSIFQCPLYLPFLVLIQFRHSQAWRGQWGG